MALEEVPEEAQLDGIVIHQQDLERLGGLRFRIRHTIPIIEEFGPWLKFRWAPRADVRSMGC